MKNILKIALGLCLSMAVFAACSDDDETQISGFSLSTEEVTLGAEGGNETVTVASEGEWVATSSKPWVSISPANGYGNTECVIKVDSTLSDQVRNAEIRFLPKGSAAKTITVSQTGFGKTIGVAQNTVELEAAESQSKRYFEAKVTTNVPIKVEIEFAEGETKEWVYLHDKKNVNPEFDREYRPRTTYVRFDWMINTNSAVREARVKFVPRDEADAEATIAEVTVTQAGSPVITDDRAGDSLAIILIEESLGTEAKRNNGDNMLNWKGVTLWERNDTEIKEGTVPSEAIGRVRYVDFQLFNTTEGLPHEVSKLKYAEELKFFSNVNSQWKDISDEPGNGLEPLFGLEYLKKLTVSSYGFLNLSNEFAKNLGDQLEYLDMSMNNFSTVPSVLTPENFPELKRLNLGACRRWTVSDLRNRNQPQYTGGIGMCFNTNENPEPLKRLLLWEKLEVLSLSYNYIEGQVPDFTVGSEGVEAWSQADVDAFGGDTIQWIAYRNIPKILPNCKSLRLNLNFFNGKMPDWLMYHPNLLMWTPTILVFNQMEEGRNSNGDVVNFSNDPGEDFEYYYKVYPKFRDKYEFKEESTDEEENTKR